MEETKTHRVSRSSALAAIGVVMALFLSSCSTARPAHGSRKGFFADLSSRQKGSRRATDRSVAARSSKDGEQKGGGARVAPTVDPKEMVALRKSGLIWPLSNVQVTSPYGQRGKEFHEGVDLRAKVGTSVLASQSGEVIYSDSKIRGYGRMVVIRHSGGLATIYAHNSRLLVHKGQKVKRGQKIALSGQTGHADGPHVHFEVRRGLIALNPQEMLPQVVAANDRITTSAAAPESVVSAQASPRRDFVGPPAPPVAQLQSARKSQTQPQRRTKVAWVDKAQADE